MTPPGTADPSGPASGAEPAEAESIQLARRVTAALATRVRHVVLAPGSRSAPLAYALAEAEQQGLLQLHVRIDERSAAFTALGIAMARAEAVGMLTTSGTATGNLLPAVMEADLAGIPLVAITADRPEELHGTGANQTLRQRGMFSGRVRGELHLAQPEDAAGDDASEDEGRDASEDSHDDAEAGEHAEVRDLLETALRRSGPVHLNIGFRDPLIPRRTPAGESGPSRSPKLEPEPEPELELEPEPGPGPGSACRAVIVLGHGAPAEAVEIAERSGQPVLAEPSSGAGRWCAGAVRAYPLLLQAPAGSAAAGLVRDVERVVVAGRPTLTRSVQRLLAGSGSVVQYARGTEAWFDERLPRRVVTSPAELAQFAGTAPARWLGRWQELGDRAQRVIDAELTDLTPLSSVRAAQLVADGVRTPLLLGSSSVIRDVDLTASAARAEVPFHALRGVSGIDGNVSAAAGLALGLERRVTALVGDLTFLHDLNALLLPRHERRPELDIVVINDAGGAIFDQLEHGEVGRRPGLAERVDRLFGTPQDVDLARVVPGYGCAYLRVVSAAELTGALEVPPAEGGIRVIEVRTDRTGLRDVHARLRDRVAQL